MFDIHLRRKPKKLPEKTVYSYNKGDFAALREPLEVQPLIGIVLSKVDIDITWTKWSNTFLAAVNTFCHLSQERKPPDLIPHPILQARLFTSYIKKKQRENEQRSWIL